VARLVFSITVTVALDSTNSCDVNRLIAFQLGPTFFQQMQRNDTAVPLTNVVTPTNLWCPAHD
jgi:hypothetical protein